MAHFSFYTFFRWSNLATQSSVNSNDVQNTALLIDFKIDLQYELQCRVGVILIDFRYSSNVYLCLYWFQWKEYWSKGLLWFYDSTTNRAKFFFNKCQEICESSFSWRKTRLRLNWQNLRLPWFGCQTFFLYSEMEKKNIIFTKTSFSFGLDSNPQQIQSFNVGFQTLCLIWLFHFLV